MDGAVTTERSSWEAVVVHQIESDGGSAQSNRAGGDQSDSRASEQTELTGPGYG